MAELSLTINGKSYPPYAFSLDGDPSEYNLEDPFPVSFDDRVSAMLSGNYALGGDPYFELSAGFDPDIEFQSLDIADGKGDLYCQQIEHGKAIKRKNLFGQVYGDSCLRLRYWKDYSNRPEESSIVLIVWIVGRIPEEKQKRLEALSSFFQNEANGHFLLDPFHGHTQKEFDLVFRSGYTSYRDPIIELDCINELLDNRFVYHLRGVVKRPASVFQPTRTLQSAARVRRLSPSNWRKIEARGSDNVSIWEQSRVPTFCTECNDVISTFLQKLHLRVRIIRSELEASHKHPTSDYNTAQATAKKLSRRPYEISGMERERSALDENTNLCGRLLSLLQSFLDCSVFSFSESRKTSVFRVPASEFGRTEHYRFLYRKILRFELTHFYWSGDRHSSFKIPSYRAVDSKGDFWIRKYSMQYEFWCYLRIYQTLKDLDFSTKDVPDVDIMRRATFLRNSLQVVLFHDVHPERQYRIENGLYPQPIGTPDFALVFECKKTGNTALIVLDAKSNATTDVRMIEARNKYLGSRLTRKPRSKSHRDPIMVQSWIILSGEGEPSKATIDCPPSFKSPSWVEKEFENLNDDQKNDVRLFCWDNRNRRFLLKKLDDPPDNWVGIGTLRSRIRCPTDNGETDVFRTFVSAEVDFMEQLLSNEDAAP